MTKDEMIKALQECDAPGDSEVIMSPLYKIMGVRTVDEGTFKDGKPLKTVRIFQRFPAE